MAEAMSQEHGKGGRRYPAIFSGKFCRALRLHRSNVEKITHIVKSPARYERFRGCCKSSATQISIAAYCVVSFLVAGYRVFVQMCDKMMQLSNYMTRGGGCR
jgi:hypothetical protein